MINWYKNNLKHTCGIIITIKNGSFNEPQKYSGYTHIAEHMMFSGTKKISLPNLRDKHLKIFNKLEATTSREDVNIFGKWFKDPKRIYTTKEMRKLSFFQKSGLNKEIEDFSNVLSNNRHCSSATLDSRGSLITNACYYRKPLFDKWCKHMIILKDLIIKIVDISSLHTT